MRNLLDAGDEEAESDDGRTFDERIQNGAMENGNRSGEQLANEAADDQFELPRNWRKYAAPASLAKDASFEAERPLGETEFVPGMRASADWNAKPPEMNRNRSFARVGQIFGGEAGRQMLSRLNSRVSGEAGLFSFH